MGKDADFPFEDLAPSLLRPAGHVPRGCCFLSPGFPDAAAHREFLESAITATGKVGSGTWSRCWGAPLLRPENLGGFAVFVLSFNHWEAEDGRSPAGTFPTVLSSTEDSRQLPVASREVLCMEWMLLPCDRLVSLHGSALSFFTLQCFSCFLTAPPFFLSRQL